MPKALLRRIGAWIAWLLAVGGLTYWFVYAGNTAALLCACGLAGLLYVLRRGARGPYGLLECLAGVLLLAQAIYSGAGRGPFSSAFSDAFTRVDPRIIALQSYAGLFLIVRGLDNICEGWSGAIEMRDGFQRWWSQVGSSQRRRQLDRGPASYSLVAAKRATTFGLFLAGLSGAALALTSTLFVQSYSLIKGDCVSRRVLAGAVHDAILFGWLFAIASGFALLAAWLPSAIGSARNFNRQLLDQRPPPIQPGHEFEGWSESRVYWVVAAQRGLLFVALLFFLVGLGSPLVSSSNPDVFRKIWEGYERACRSGSEPLGQGYSLLESRDVSVY